MVQPRISNHKKLLDSNANFEEFDAYSDQLHKRHKGQTLRFYNPETHQWSIYLRYVWLNNSPKSVRMEQSWSADGGGTWEVNWICEQSR